MSERTTIVHIDSGKESNGDGCATLLVLGAIFVFVLFMGYGWALSVGGSLVDGIFMFLANL